MVLMAAPLPAEDVLPPEGRGPPSWWEATPTPSVELRRLEATVDEADWDHE